MIERNFDKEYGGIGSAPKFPQPASLEWLLKYWRNSAFQEEPDIEALFLCTLTLKNMAEGGLYDQVGGGFFAIVLIETGKYHTLKRCFTITVCF